MPYGITQCYLPPCNGDLGGQLRVELHVTNKQIKYRCDEIGYLQRLKYATRRCSKQFKRLSKYWHHHQVPQDANNVDLDCGINQEIVECYGSKSAAFETTRNNEDNKQLQEINKNNLIKVKRKPYKSICSYFYYQSPKVP